MNIQLQDSLLIFSLLYFFGFILLLSIPNKDNPNLHRSFPFFAGYFLLNFVGVYGIYFRGYLPLFISIIAANFILYISQVSLVIAITKFYNLIIPWKTIAVATILYLSLYLVFTYVYSYYQIRILIYGLGLIFNLSLVYYRHSQQNGTFSFTKNILNFTLFMLILISVSRLFMLLIPNSADNFLDYNFDSINIIASGIAGNMIAFGILSIVFNSNLDEIKSVGKIFENSIKNAPAPIMIHAEDGTVLNISQSWTNISGYKISDIPTINDWTEKAYGLNKSEVLDFISNLYEPDINQHDGEFVVTTKDKRKRTWDFNSGYVGNLPDGRAVAMSVAVDVTERLLKEKEISYLSYHDQLTGLYNRRFFEEQQKRLDNPRNLPLSIIVGDVNGLKLINDAFGHQVGDQLLKMIGSIISKSLRGNDVAARWGGDEFAMLLPNSESEAAEILINRIQKKINEASFEFGKVSISFGIATKKSNDEGIKDVFNSAEELMYQNKLAAIDSIRGETINTIMNTLFEKSVEVKEHSLRVSDLAVSIAENMGLSKAKINDIKTMGLIHDIGKIVIDLNILDKPGKLSPEELTIIQQHPLSGSRMLSSSHEYTRLAVGVLHHHERIDGSGYPNGLTGDQIPLESKIIAVADAFDAMTRERPYRLNPLSIEETIAELKKHRGTQFDKKVVDVLVKKVLLK